MDNNKIYEVHLAGMCLGMFSSKQKAEARTSKLSASDQECVLINEYVVDQEISEYDWTAADLDG